LPALDNEHLFLARAGHPEVNERTVVSSADTARMLVNDGQEPRLFDGEVAVS